MAGFERGRAPDRALVDLDHLVEHLHALDRVWAPGLGARPLQPVGERLVDDVVDERRLARAGDAGDGDEAADREARRRRLSGCARAAPRTVNQPLSAARRAGTSIERAPERKAPVSDLRLRSTLRRGPCGDHVAAVLAGSRPHVDEPVGAAHHLLVVLDDEHRVAEVAQRLERPDQAVVVALVQADRRLVEDVEHADELRADLGGETQPLRLAARERRARRGRAAGSRRRRSRGSSAAHGSP